MGWRIVQQPNGKLARWSDVVDDFTHSDMTSEEAVALCREMGLTYGEAEEKIYRAIVNIRRFEDCIGSIELIHGKETAEQRRAELTLDRKEP